MLRIAQAFPPPLASNSSELRRRSPERPVFPLQTFDPTELARVGRHQRRASTSSLTRNQHVVRPDPFSGALQFSAHASGLPSVVLVEERPLHENPAAGSTHTNAVAAEPEVARHSNRLTAAIAEKLRRPGHRTTSIRLYIPSVYTALHRVTTLTTHVRRATRRRARGCRRRSRPPERLRERRQRRR